MKTLLCTVGLPRSGKTTWALAFSKDHGCPIVNPDSIRLAIHGQRFIGQAEPFVWATAQAMVASLFIAGHDSIIVDATHTTRKRREIWKSKDWRTLFVMIDTPKSVCLERATGDAEIVPVIERMAAQWEPLSEEHGEIAVKTLGATGAFPDGALDLDHDEGEIRLAIAADKKAGVVRVEFGKPLAWLGLPRQEAMQFAEVIRFHAGKLG